MRWFVVGVVGFLAIGLGYNSPAYERTCKAQKGEKKSDEGEDHAPAICVWQSPPEGGKTSQTTNFRASALNLRP